MTKICFISDYVNSNVLPKLSSSANEIKNISNVVSSLDVPSFEYSGYLGSLSSIFSNCELKCLNDFDFINDSVIKFSELNEECCEDIRNVEVYNITEKEVYIN